jgi:hypothetical protein
VTTIAMPTDPSSGKVFLKHFEGQSGRVGYAEYDANTGYFSCRTCVFELTASAVVEILAEKT